MQCHTRDALCTSSLKLSFLLFLSTSTADTMKDRILWPQQLHWVLYCTKLNICYLELLYEIVQEWTKGPIEKQGNFYNAFINIKLSSLTCKNKKRYYGNEDDWDHFCHLDLLAPLPRLHFQRSSRLAQGVLCLQRCHACRWNFSTFTFTCWKIAEWVAWRARSLTLPAGWYAKRWTDVPYSI